MRERERASERERREKESKLEKEKGEYRVWGSRLDCGLCGLCACVLVRGAGGGAGGTHAGHIYGKEEGSRSLASYPLCSPPPRPPRLDCW